MKKTLKVIRNLLLALAALLLVLLVSFQIVMRPALLTSLVNRVAASYVEGSVSFDEVKAHAIKSFPYLHLEARRLDITYPHERFERYDSLYPDPGRRFSLMKAGIARDSSRVDTLASIRELDLWLDYPALLRHEIYVHRARLTRPRVFAHYYDSTAANWHIIGSAPADTTLAPADSAASRPWRIRLGKIDLEDRPFIVYTDPVDTLHGAFRLHRLSMDGHLDLQNLEKTYLDLEIDSLRVSGRLPADTLSVRLNHLDAHMKDRAVRLQADASTRLRTHGFGRLTLPVSIDLDASSPEDGKVDVRRLKLGLSVIDMEGSGTLARREDGTMEMDVRAAVEDCPLGDVFRELRPNFAFFRKVETDAHLHLDASARGVYGQGMVPAIQASLQIPQALLEYEGMGRKGGIALNATLTTDDGQVVHADIHRLLVDILGAKINASGSVEDLLGEDPLIRLDAAVRARVDSLARAFTDDITGSGIIDGSIRGRALLSQLDMVHIGAASIQGDLTARELRLEDAPDSLSAYLPALKLDLSTKANSIDRNIPKDARVLALKADMDSLYLSYGKMFIRGRDLQLLLQNSADILKGGKELTPLMGLLKAGGLRLRDGDGLGIAIREGRQAFRITPATAGRPVPRLSLSSRNSGVIIRSGADLYAFRPLNFSLAASRHQVPSRTSTRLKQRLDSLQRIYPDVPRDSLLWKARGSRLARQDDFAGADISISLGDALKKYWREWDLEGKLEVGSGRLALPAFPLPTRLSEVKGSFDNDTLRLDNITLQAGASDLSAQLRLSGLRRAFLGRSRTRLQLKADVQSTFLDANELLRAYAYFSTYEPPRELKGASDEAVEKAVSRAELPDSAGRKLIVIPSNLEVDFSMEASGIRYDSLLVSWAAADVGMRDRTIQVTNALAASNMGDIYFEGFYATRSKEDIKAGFDLNLVHITAEKVITLFPAVDTLMPMLTSFAGDLDCELAATSDIDTTMNLVLPSIDGILKISGKDLSIKDSPEFTRIAKLLQFRNKENALVDNMSVTGMIHDNTLEIFPFVLDVDRYQMAASGRQYLNESFNYHVSVIRSPLLMKFGLNAWGPDFDHIHYGLGPAKYRSANVPVYTKQLDTVHFNLVAAIHNVFELGVEKALAENRTRDLLPSGEDLPMEVTAAGDSLSHLEALLEGTAGGASARREALKEEILRLQMEAAKRDEQ